MLSLLQRKLADSLKFTLCRTFLSVKYDDVMNKRLDWPSLDSDTNRLNPFDKKLHAVDVSLFINRLNPNEDRQAEVCDLLMKLRSQANATDICQSTSHAVVKYFVEGGHIQELMAVFQNPLLYGIFLDHFTGCYLLSHLLKSKDILKARQVAVELMHQEYFDNELLSALSIKACYGYLKEHGIEPAVAERVEQTATKASNVQKVRVKFIRNETKKPSTNFLFGKTIVKMSEKCPTDVKHNMKLLGHLLCDETSKFMELCESEGNIFYKDVLDLCHEVLKSKLNEQEKLMSTVKRRLDANPKLEPFEQILTESINTAALKEESKLIRIQEENYVKWAQELESKMSEELRQRTIALRLAKVENIKSEINSQKEKLWFFDLEDKYDLQIFQKKKIYPKRWFGKKKKPRVVDDSYVPPEVKRRN